MGELGNQDSHSIISHSQVKSLNPVSIKPLIEKGNGNTTSKGGCISGFYPIKTFNKRKKMYAGQVQCVTRSNNKKGNTLKVRGD